MVKKGVKKALDNMGDPINSIKDGIALLKLPNRTFGEKAADWITNWAGSWSFILLFFIVIIIWISLNGYYLINLGKKPFDPFPYILLNLGLSLLAAIQAPVILMSQNRQSKKDRLKAEYDYKINKKAEKEIREIKIHLNKIEKMINRKLSKKR
ncbi:MAG: DUF1003 domain-containing protein [Candidatus Nanoarchaeia archaeon]